MQLCDLPPSFNRRKLRNVRAGIWQPQALPLGKYRRLLPRKCPPLQAATKLSLEGEPGGEGFWAQLQGSRPGRGSAGPTGGGGQEGVRPGRAAALFTHFVGFHGQGQMNPHHNHSGGQKEARAMTFRNILACDCTSPAREDLSFSTPFVHIRMWHCAGEAGIFSVMQRSPPTSEARAAPGGTPGRSHRCFLHLARQRSPRCLISPTR